MSSSLSLLGLFLLAGYAMGLSHESNGASGETCGPEDRKCILGKATCNSATGKCDCNSDYQYGNGYTNCYKNNTFRTEVFNDPNIMTYNGNSVGLPLPCRYLWTHTQTYLKNKRREQVGVCDFQVHAFHQKAKGKFYLGGYDVAIKLMYANGTEISMSIRKYGKAADGEYNYIVNATDGQYLPHGGWNDDVIDFHDPATNLRIKCEFDDDNNLAIIHAKKCGIRIQFRPYDCVLKRLQPMIPHAAFEVNCAFHPVFMNMDNVAAIAPAADHGGMTIDDVIIPGLTREEYMVYRALGSGAVQNSPSPNPECALTKSKLDGCNSITLVKAFQGCMWILQLPRFIRCWDTTTSGVDIMELFNDCVDVYCNGANCQDLINDITMSMCHTITPPYAEVTEFVSGSMCP